MSQTPNPAAYDAWNKRPKFMTDKRYTGNQWEEIHAWLDAALRSEYRRGREDAALIMAAALGDQQA